MKSREALDRFAQADSLYRDGRPAESLSILEELNGAYPGNKNIMYPLARCLAKLSRTDEALDLCSVLIHQHHVPKAEDLRGRLLEHKSQRPGYPFPDDDLSFEAPDIEIEEGITFETPSDSEPETGTPRPWLRPLAVSLVVAAVLVAGYFLLFS